MSLEQITQTLNKIGEKAQAVALLNTFAKHAWQFLEYDDLAKCFFKLKLYVPSIKYAELALTTAYTMERSWAARANMINVLNHANYPESALFHIAIQERLIPDDQDTRLEKAFSYFLMNDLCQAEQILRDELKRADLKPETITKIQFNLGTYHLWRDEFQIGLGLFLHKGEELDYWRKSKLPFKFWNGGIMPGRKIVLYAEAGIGDEIINVRFMKHLERFGMTPIWYTDRKDMVRIFNANGFQATSNMDQIKSILREDPSLMWTYPMSLPVYLNLEYKDLWHGPYLKSLPEFDRKWEQQFSSSKLKIGLRWQGNPEYDQDLHRSVPLDGIWEQVKDLDAEFYSIQKDTGLEELHGHPIIDLSEQLTTFEDTLSVIARLDVVITSCTSVAHAAAAMGKRVFIFTPISSYYTWSHSGDQTPWYGENVTLLRQTKPRVWDAALHQLNVLSH